MIDLILERYIPRIQNELRLGESFDDFKTMCEIIAVRRQESSNAPRIEKNDVRIALRVLCILPFPGKPPSYKKRVRELRRDFKGIFESETLKDRFRSILTPRILSMTNFRNLDSENIDIELFFQV